MTFGTRLRQARNKKGLTQEKAAQTVGINFTTISKYENNRSQPDNETLQRLAALYETSIDWLLTGDHPAKQKRSYIIWFDGEQEELTKDEAKHLKDSLEMYRLLQAKRLSENKTKPTN